MPLSVRRRQFRKRNPLRDPLLQSKPHQRGGGHDEHVVVAPVQLLQAFLDVTPNIAQARRGKPAPAVFFTANTADPDLCVDGKIGNATARRLAWRPPSRQDESIAGIFGPWQPEPI